MRQLPNACWLYCPFALLFGLLFAFLIPPNGMPDESAHQVKVVRVAIGNFFGANHAIFLPTIDSWYGPFDNKTMVAGSKTFSSRDVLDTTSRPLVCANTTVASNDTVTAYSPILYLLPAAIYTISCWSGASFGAYLYTARVGNLIVAVVLITTAIALSEWSAWPIMCVALLPSFICQTASISADSLLFGLAALLIGVVTGLVTRQISAHPWMFVAIALAVLLGFSKPALLWIALAALPLLPSWRTGGRSTLSFFLLFLGLPTLAHAALIASSLGSTPIVPGTEPMEGLRVLTGNPLKLLRLIAHVPSAYPTGTTWNIWESLVGKLGYLTVPLPDPIYHAAYVGLLLLPFCGPAGRPFPLGARAAFSAVSLVSIPAIALPLYLFATPPHHPVIFGLQGRYFLPSLILAATALSFGWRARTLTRAATYTIVVLVTSVSLHSILRSFYGAV